MKHGVLLLILGALVAAIAAGSAAGAARGHADLVFELRALLWSFAYFFSLLAGYYVLRPLFSRVPGVGTIQVQATDTREVSVIVNPQKMLAHRLSIVDIAGELRATNEVTSVGRLAKDYSQYLVLTTSQFVNLDDIRNSVVAIDNGTPIRVRDLAEVR